VPLLLDALEKKTLPAAQISVAARAQLSRHRDEKIAARAAAIFGAGTGNRAEVIGRYQTALALAGNADRGAQVYEQICMVCHRLNDRGNDIGPNLATVKSWTPDQILTNVLDPNREVSPNFALYIAETKDGRSVSGLMASESAGNVVLKRADGGTEELLRTDLKSLTSPGISLMPEGLEVAITPQQMADLIAYIRK
jgi:putative heme-binding domain-containing protein